MRQSGRVVGCAVLLWVLSGTACAWAEERPSTISVRGEGEVRSPPDLAQVRVGVVAENEAADAAQKQVNRAANQILAEVAKLDVKERDIRTVELQISPVYSNPRDTGERRGPRISGYQASNVVLVTVRDLERVGSVIDAALAAGGNRIDGVEFALSDDREERKQALERAVQDAREKADAISNALGSRLGKVVSVVEQGASVGPIVRQRLASTMLADSTPTAPGELSVAASVLIEYAIAE